MKTFEIIGDGPLKERAFEENKLMDGKWHYIIKGDDIEIRDEYHSMHELYQHRMALNIALFSAWYEIGFDVCKSKLHYDGTMFEGYFIVMAKTPEGQVSYHYELEHWNKFGILELERAWKWDGHGSKEVIERLMKL